MKRNVVQYVHRGMGYAPIGETVQTLESGYYDILSDNGILVYVPRVLNTDKLLHFEDTKSDQVIKEIEHFWKLKETFHRYGLVHKRGFLLYGPPGSGKTSTIAIVIDKMARSGGIVINGTSMPPSYLKKMLFNFREIEPARPLVVTFEDLENVLHQDESTMLALLDGDASIDNVVFLATTNYPEKLDARIINRPSRFDQVVYIDMPSRSARKQYLLHCDASFEDAVIEKWLDLTNDFSIAQLKEVVIGVRCFGHTVEAITQRLRGGNVLVNVKNKNQTVNVEEGVIN